MAKNKVFVENKEHNRAIVVPSGTKAGDFVVVGDTIAVAITDRGDATRSETFDEITIGYPSGGFGLAADEATCAFDGTWELPVTGADDFTANRAPVYLASAGYLTLTKGSNTRVGQTDYPKDYTRRDGYAPVQIGAN